MDNDYEPLLSRQETNFTNGQANQYGSLEASSVTTSLSSSEPFSIEGSRMAPRTSSLSVVGLSYVVKERRGHWWNGSCFRSSHKKLVLNNLCMTFSSGQLTGLVGSSGSGKTSLLDVISGRAQGEATGVVSYNHEPCTRQMMKQRSSYVLQADRLLPTLTVRETFTYMAYLKLPGHLKGAEIKAKVQQVIDDMGLRNVAESRIGGAVVRGVSGGEKRRITIGVQLLKDPEILLLDEPTSGLDAFTARHLVASLAELAHKDKLVIMSIHQPRPDIFNLLDKLAILTVGQLAFLGAPNQLVPYFTSIGYPCPRDKNPCDVYVDIVSVDRRTPDQEKSTTKIAQSLCHSFANSDLQAQVIKDIVSDLNHHYTDTYDMAYSWRNGWPSWPRKFKCLITRMNIHLWRDRPTFMARLFTLSVFTPFILMFLGRLGHNQGSIQDRLGIIYQVTQVTPYAGMTNAIALFPVLREVFYRECHDGLYSTLTFLLAHFVHCLPFNIISAGMFTCIFYWVAGLQNDLWVFGSFLLVTMILSQFGEMLTVAVLGMFRDAQLANNTTALIFSASGLLSSGLLRSVGNLPIVLQWAGYVAIHKYTTEIVVANEFHNLNFTCDHPGQQCLRNGDDYLKAYYPGALDHRTRNFSILGCYSGAIIILALLIFKIRGIPTLH